MSDAADAAPARAVNPFYADWFLAAASGRLFGPETLHPASPPGFPVQRQARLGRLPLPHRAGLHHDHCFCGLPPVGIGALRSAAGRGLLRLRGVPDDHPLTEELAASGALIVDTKRRAVLRAGPDCETFLREAVRAKKRKEWRRLTARLSEAAEIAEARIGGDEDTGAWADDFLSLEAAGWKGEAGTAMAASAAERGFLRAVLAGAQAAGALRAYKLTADGAPIAMLIAFAASDGGLYTYKIAHDPAFARYSPGIMVILTLTRDVLDGGAAAYVDSCASEGHPMIEHVWRDRRVLHDWIVPGGPVGRAMAAGLARIGQARVWEGRT